MSGFLTALTGAAAAGRGFGMADDIIKYGQGLYNYDSATETATGAMPALGAQLAEGSAFQGYGVSTGLGTSTVSQADGANPMIDLGVGQDPHWRRSAYQNQHAGDVMRNLSRQDNSERQQELYNQNMAVQNPMLNQMQAQQRADEFAMGRQGVSGSQFGGSSEDAAMARARVQGSNQAYQIAQQQGLAEQAQQAQMAQTFNQMGSQSYQNSFQPMNQQMQMMQLAGQDADRYQTGQLTGQGYLGQLNLGGIQAGVNSMKAASELEGNIYDSIFDNASGLLSGLF